MSLDNLVISMALAGLMVLNPLKGEKDYISIDEMYIYGYGIVDLNGDKKTDAGDVFFIAIDLNGDGKSDMVYIHSLEYFEEYKDSDGKMRNDIDVYRWCDEIWYDLDGDTKFEYKEKKQVNNEKFFYKLFEGHVK